jgi:hypothetical protein
METELVTFTGVNCSEAKFCVAITIFDRVVLRHHFGLREVGRRE